MTDILTLLNLACIKHTGQGLPNSCLEATNWKYKVIDGKKRAVWRPSPYAEPLRVGHPTNDAEHNILRKQVVGQLNFIFKDACRIALNVKREFGFWYIYGNIHYLLHKYNLAYLMTEPCCSWMWYSQRFCEEGVLQQIKDWWNLQVKETKEWGITDIDTIYTTIFDLAGFQWNRKRYNCFDIIDYNTERHTRLVRDAYEEVKTKWEQDVTEHGHIHFSEWFDDRIGYDHVLNFQNLFDDFINKWYRAYPRVSRNDKLEDVRIQRRRTISHQTHKGQGRFFNSPELTKVYRMDKTINLNSIAVKKIRENHNSFIIYERFFALPCDIAAGIGAIRKGYLSLVSSSIPGFTISLTQNTGIPRTLIDEYLGHQKMRADPQSLVKQSMTASGNIPKTKKGIQSYYDFHRVLMNNSLHPKKLSAEASGTLCGGFGPNIYTHGPVPVGGAQNGQRWWKFLNWNHRGKTAWETIGGPASPHATFQNLSPQELCRVYSPNRLTKAKEIADRDAQIKSNFPTGHTWPITAQ